MALPTERDTRLWLALLYEIGRQGGEVRPRNVYGSVRTHFPEITDEDLSRENPRGGNTWTNRVQWVRQHLVERGCIDPSTSGVWRITALGREWLGATWHGADADYSSVAKPAKLPKPDGALDTPASARGRTKSAEPGRKRAPVVEQEPIQKAEATTPAATADPTETLCQRLLKSQHQSSAPEQFEKDLTEAFQALGFDAKHIGGSGETDIHASAPLGQSSYSIVVDAKSTSSARVSEAQINWLAIDSHRKARGATYAAVIGSDFGGGNLLKFAGDFSIVLIRTEMIGDLLQTHAKTPFNLFQLRDLFLSPGLADSGMKTPRERHSQHRRHWALIAEIVDTLGQFGPDGLKHDNLYHILRALAISRGKAAVEVPTQLDVADAIAFLASRAVGVLAEVQGSGGAYQLAMSTKTARERLRALARAFDQAGGSQAAAAAPAGLGLSTI